MRQAWQNFIENKPVSPSDHTPQVSIESWARRREYGIDHLAEAASGVLGGPDLGDLPERNRLLVDIASPFMEIIYSYVRGSGFSVAPLDAGGYIVNIIGDEEAMGDHRGGGFVKGSCWLEQNMSANGRGATLVEQAPIQVRTANTSADSPIPIPVPPLRSETRKETSLASST